MVDEPKESVFVQGGLVMSRFLYALASIVLLAAMPTAALSQSSHHERVARANQGTVSIISGGIGGTYIRIATDLAAILDDGEDLRILPIAGKGSMQNIHDILYLKGIDLGIVQSDVLKYIKREKLYPGIERRLRYVTKLYNEEFHLVARDDITSIDQLAGKKVNFGGDGGGTHMTASTIFNGLDIDVEPTDYDQALAMEKLKAGEIDAVAYVAGKPARTFADVEPEDRLRLVAVPYVDALQDTYLPSSFQDSDYPSLVPSGSEVETLAVGAVMAVFNWNKGTSRYRRVENFIEAFFAKFDQFQKAPRHNKWKEVNLNAKVPGWQRFEAAESWLKEHEQVASVDLESTFQQFLDQQVSAEAGRELTATERDLLFEQFLQWQRNQVQ